MVALNRRLTNAEGSAGLFIKMGIIRKVETAGEN